MAKSKRQKDLTDQVQARLTSEGPIRVEASAVKSGKSGGASEATKKTLHGIHPSLEGVTAELSEAGLESGRVITPSGLAVSITKGPRAKAYAPHGEGLAPQQGKTPLPPVEEGISQRYETRIGHEHGTAKAAEITAEADAVARRPNPLRSDGHVDALVALHSPSVGGNRLGHGGAISRLAKMEGADLPQSKVARAPRGDASNFPSLANGPVFAGPKDMALHSLGYTDEVQTQMLKTARDRITRRQGRGLSPALTQTEIHSRAYAQVNEHLDEALHGTKGNRTDRGTQGIINDLAAEQEGGARGFAVLKDSPKEGAGQTPRRGPAPTGPGMTKSRTPIQRAQRQAVRDLTRRGTFSPEQAEKRSFAERSRGGWSALKNADDHTTAAQNDLIALDLKQKARRASAIAPEERVTDSPGAHPEQKARRHAQPVFSTGPAAPFAASPNVGVGVPSEKGAEILPARARQGAVSPVPSDLPTEPARLGRTREERGVGVPRDYGQAIADYAASRPGVTPKSQRATQTASAVPATESNVAVAQTKTPAKRRRSKNA